MSATEQTKTLKEALELIGPAEAVTLFFIEKFELANKDEYSMAWKLFFRYKHDIAVSLANSTICKTHNLMNLPVSEIRSKGSHKDYYGDHEESYPSQIEIFVHLPKANQDK